MHTHFPLPKHTNLNQPTAQPAKTNTVAEEHLNTADRKHGRIVFLLQNRHYFQQIYGLHARA